jgi:hypothetical protein
MALKATNLYIEMAALPATFKGSPQDLAVAMVKRMRISSPSGTNFIFIGDVEPTSNVGPWLKGGTQWFVWSEVLKKYVPVDLSASATTWYFIGATEPTGGGPTQLWLRTTLDATDLNSSHGTAIGWYVFDGAEWVPFNNIVASGPTAGRPASPVDFQQYYDTDIGVLIWWERAAWRTVSGVPGDIKYVVYQVATDALRFNPGWDLFGNSNQDWRGRLVVMAAKDAGGSPATVLPTDAGITQRAAFETFGEGAGLAVDNLSLIRTPGAIAMWTLVKL